MTQAVNFTGGTAVFSFDSATAPVGANCLSPVCGINDLSANLFDALWDESMVTSYGVVFNPATKIAIWQISLLSSPVPGTEPDSTTSTAITLAGEVGGTFKMTGHILEQFSVPGPCSRNDQGTIFCEEPRTERLIRPLPTSGGTWTAPVVTDTSVPEPGTAALALVGLGAALRRRRRPI